MIYIYIFIYIYIYLILKINIFILIYDMNYFLLEYILVLYIKLKSNILYYYFLIIGKK
jgi:hypothetical protein